MTNNGQIISGWFLGDLSRGISTTKHYLDSGVGLSFDESHPPYVQQTVRSQNQQSPPARQELPVSQVNNEHTENSVSDHEYAVHSPREPQLTDHVHAQPRSADKTTLQDQVPLALPESNTTQADRSTDYSSFDSSRLQDRKGKKVVSFAVAEPSDTYQEPSTKSSPDQDRDVKKNRFSLPEPETIKAGSSNDPAPLHDSRCKKKVTFLLPPPELTRKEPSANFKARGERKRAKKEEFALLRSISIHDEFGVTTADRENGEDVGTVTTGSRPVLIIRRPTPASIAKHLDGDDMDQVTFIPSRSRPLVPVEQIVNARPSLAQSEERSDEANDSRADGSEGTSIAEPEVRLVHRSIFRGSPAVGLKSQELAEHLLAYISSVPFRQRSRPFMAPVQPMLCFPSADDFPALRQARAQEEERIRRAQTQRTTQARKDLDVLTAYAREATKTSVFFSPRYDNLPAEEPPERDLWSSTLM